MQSVLLSMLSILYYLCRDFVDPWALDCLSIPIGDLVLDGEGTAINLVGGSFKCASWSFTDHFCVRMYSSGLANGGLCFLFKLPRLFDCRRWVYFNFHFKCAFSFYGGGIFFFFLWSWSWSMSTFCSLCFICFGRICCFIFCWVVFDIYYFY